MPAENALTIHLEFSAGACAFFPSVDGERGGAYSGAQVWLVGEVLQFFVCLAPAIGDVVLYNFAEVSERFPAGRTTARWLVSLH